MRTITRCDYASQDEYGQMLIDLDRSLHYTFREANDAAGFDTLNPLTKLAIRIAWLSGAGPILTLGVLISGPKAFKYFDIRNILIN